MASGFTPAAKHSRTINVGASVRKQAKELGIPWEDNCPAQISDWLLASILPNAASLMGQSTIKVGYQIKAESINLFLICLCDPRAGKSPAFHHGCAQPVRLHVEAREDIPLFEDEFKATPGHNVWKGRGYPALWTVTGRVKREKQDWPGKVDSAVWWEPRGCTQVVTRQHARSSTIQGCHWVDMVSPTDFSPFMLSWRGEKKVRLTGWLYINHSRITRQPVRQESSSQSWMTW